ncbi:cell division protein FtsZ [Kordiimonas aquimaris]|uniref:cell division protein FtsZ n=1 Tax=Kordiimonas aquimaris TaxID=707591 RepID=UPI0021D31AD7|nr:cell division protein FtsZ [Kordiimonas aquimaris]
MSIDFGNTELTELTPRIAVIGVGGAGCNAVNNMISAQLQGVDFIVANTDAQALANADADNRIQLGVEITQGLGAGAQPKIGEAAAEEALERIDEVLAGCHMAFVTAGMGGGTGTGAAPVIARRAREKGILTVGVVTKPFQFEGGRRMKIAEAGIQDLAGNVDTLIIIPNQNLFRVANERTTFADAFNMADEVLHSGVRGITDLMVMPGLINLDFADVRTVMSEMGKAMMGTGEAEGDNRAADAAAAAISNPLLEEASLKGAKGVIINVTGGMDMTLFEVDEAVNMVRDQVDTDALIVFGSAFNQDLEGKLRVSVVATGIEGSGASLPIPEPIRTKEETPVASESEIEVSEEVSMDTATSDESVDVEEETTAIDTDVEEEVIEDLTLPSFADANDAEEVAGSVQIEDTQSTLDRIARDLQGRNKPVVNEEEDLEAKALQSQGDDLFVAEAPMAPKVTFTEALQPSRANEEAYVSDTQDREERAVEQPVVEEEHPQKRSLFQIMTSSLRPQDAEKPSVVTPSPASNDSGASQEVHSQDAIGGVSAEDRPAPAAKSEQLEIPSFLRRQQN